MTAEPEDQPPPLPQITLRGLFLANTVIGIFVSFLTTLGLGEVSLGLLVIWGAIGVLFLVQWGLLWLVMRFFQQPPDDRRMEHDPRNMFPSMPRDR